MSTRYPAMILARLSLLVMLITSSSSIDAAEPSTCFGSTSDGYLQNGWELPLNGSNFTAYSATARLMGRVYVHSTVHDILLAAYAAMELSVPGKVFVYGETGFVDGGHFKPHKTHRNGLSVDFMVPVVDNDGNSMALPTNLLNKWGYDLEFDGNGRLGELSIDAEAMAEHIYQLHIAATASGHEIWRVIFDPALQPLLKHTLRWEYLEQNVQFSRKRSWVRHDEHYHVDFEVPCKAVD